ncbi:transposase [Bacillus sp. REN16]|uniref:transposase n=1 Tax=Bacillus sp. REN16 TaxID=2887296 RepID=UPI001E4E3B65|nr:transposase [Bacillus sp. REN16]MCC3358753.1 transposase [Bacillus sp. REN16]
MLDTTLIKEKKSTYIDHDRLFKMLIKSFFQEFMEAFFPEECAFINFSTVKFMEQEVITDIFKGEKRRIDILAEVTMKFEDKLILIHVEPQSYYQEEFNERMFIYLSRLYEKYRIPILPIAVFSYNERKDIPQKFTINFPTSQILEFNYLQLHLKKKNWREFIKTDNPAVAALLSNMGYTKEERIQVRLEFLRMISRMELDPARMELLYGFFETYLKLTREEEVQVEKEIAKLPEEEADRILELPNSYFERGIEKGMEKRGVELVKNMHKRGLSVEQIADYSGISLEKVKEIIKNSSQY